MAATLLNVGLPYLNRLGLGGEPGSTGLFSRQEVQMFNVIISYIVIEKPRLRETLPKLLSKSTWLLQQPGSVLTSAAAPRLVHCSLPFLSLDSQTS